MRKFIQFTRNSARAATVLLLALLDLEPEIVMLEKIDTDELTRLAREMLGKNE